jgi:hypothetical protein
MMDVFLLSIVFFTTSLLSMVSFWFCFRFGLKLDERRK